MVVLVFTQPNHTGWFRNMLYFVFSMMDWLTCSCLWLDWKPRHPFFSFTNNQSDPLAYRKILMTREWMMSAALSLCHKNIALPPMLTAEASSQSQRGIWAISWLNGLLFMQWKGIVCIAPQSDQRPLLSWRLTVFVETDRRVGHGVTIAAERRVRVLHLDA